MKILTIALLLFLFASPVSAQDNLRHPELKKFEAQGGSVEFLGNAYGLDGWLLVKEGSTPHTVYTTPEGGLVMGMLVNPQGTIETQSQLLALKARADGSQAALPGADKTFVSQSEKFYAELEKANWTRVGQESAPYIYVFMNVNCDDCKAYWKDLQKPVADGKLQVRLLPFGRKALNRDGGGAMLSAENPGEAWTRYINGDEAVFAKEKALPAGLAAVDANSDLLAKWKITGAPPYSIYRRLSDGKVTAIIGRPENTMLVMADLIK